MPRQLGIALACALAACASPPRVDAPPPPSASATEAPVTQPASRTEWNGSEVVLASIDEARQLLGASDAFTRAMGDFDRGVRVGRDGSVTEQAFLEHASAQARGWPDDVAPRWAAAANEIGEALRGLGVRFPPKVMLVLSSGKEEMDAPYTRGNAIIIPIATATRLSDPFPLLAHEMFHVASRHDPTIRDALYATLGFRRVPAVAYPKEIAQRRITNPDAPTFEHAIKVKRKADGNELEVVALFYSKKPLAEAITAGLQASLALELVELPGGPDGPRIIPVATTDYLERASINTEYAIHPEETLADNFALILRRRAKREINAPRRDVLDQIEGLLTKR
ncbi:MAG: hypothetical protein JNK04_03290 [Myxococcales bacterium]|nr:hypothetical protein [Myxococcales bacterium]